MNIDTAKAAKLRGRVPSLNWRYDHRTKSWTAESFLSDRDKKAPRFYRVTEVSLSAYKFETPNPSQNDEFKKASDAFNQAEVEEQIEFDPYR